MVGGGYFTRGVGHSNEVKGTGAVGGQCGCPWSGRTKAIWYTNRAGSGGQAGAGGTIKVSSLARIYAYNGDMITNGDYVSEYYEYNKDGTVSSNKLNVITKLDGTSIIPCKIFAQTGIIRKTYTTNQGEWSLSKVKTGETLPAVATSYDTVELVIATNETPTDKTGYTNGYMLNQGIGSGAGYLESSNGTYTLCNEVNGELIPISD